MVSRQKLKWYLVGNSIADIIKSVLYNTRKLFGVDLWSRVVMQWDEKYPWLDSEQDL